MAQDSQTAERLVEELRQEAADLHRLYQETEPLMDWVQWTAQKIDRAADALAAAEARIAELEQDEPDSEGEKLLAQLSEISERHGLGPVTLPTELETERLNGQFWRKKAEAAEAEAADRAAEALRLREALIGLGFPQGGREVHPGRRLIELQWVTPEAFERANRLAALQPPGEQTSGEGSGPEIVYECGCEAGGHNVAPKCPMHGRPIALLRSQPTDSPQGEGGEADHAG